MSCTRGTPGGPLRSNSAVGSPVWKSTRGFPKMGGTPIAGWFTKENPIKKWMMTGGTPILGNPHTIWYTANECPKTEIIVME